MSEQNASAAAAGEDDEVGLLRRQYEALIDRLEQARADLAELKLRVSGFQDLATSAEHANTCASDTWLSALRSSGGTTAAAMKARADQQEAGSLRDGYVSILAELEQEVADRQRSVADIASQCMNARRTLVCAVSEDHLQSLAREIGPRLRAAMHIHRTSLRLRETKPIPMAGDDQLHDDVFYTRLASAVGRPTEVDRSAGIEGISVQPPDLDGVDLPLALSPAAKHLANHSA